MTKLDPVLQEKLLTLVGSMGYELLGCELAQQGGQNFFRIFIDKPNGLTVEDCSKVSHQVSAMLDVLDPIKGKYRLEVSSPGIDRPLFTLEQYQKHIGHQVKIRLYTAIDNRRNYTGLLSRVKNGNIYLLIDGMGNEITLPFSNVEKGNVIGEVHLTK